MGDRISSKALAWTGAGRGDFPGPVAAEIDVLLVRDRQVPRDRTVKQQAIRGLLCRVLSVACGERPAGARDREGRL